MVTVPIDIGVITSVVQTTYPNGPNGQPVQTPIPLSQVTALLGIGPFGAFGADPGVTALPPQSLPGILGKGVLINAYNAPAGGGGVLQFGPNPLPEVTSITADPTTFTSNLSVTFTVQGQTYPYSLPSTIDSGGLYGFIPSTLTSGTPSLPKTPNSNDSKSYLPPNSNIMIQAGPTVLEDYTVPAYPTPPCSECSPPSPWFSGETHFNSGYIPFTRQPIYVSYDPVGTMIFDAVSLEWLIEM